MNNSYIIVLIIIAVAIFTWWMWVKEGFNMDHYLRPNYQSGANMLRGDLNIAKTRQSWFNTKYGPASLAPGFFKPM